MRLGKAGLNCQEESLTAALHTRRCLQVMLWSIWPGCDTRAGTDDSDRAGNDDVFAAAIMAGGGSDCQCTDSHVTASVPPLVVARLGSCPGPGRRR